jgi:hypothetical protein
MPLSNSTLADIARFARMPECKVFLELVEHRLAEADAKTRTASGEEVFRSQGRAQALDALLQDIKRARESLQRAVGSTQHPQRAASWNPA